ARSPQFSGENHFSFLSCFCQARGEPPWNSEIRAAVQHMRIDLAETASAFSRMIEARERFRDRASFQKPARADVPRAYVQAFFVCQPNRAQRD
ncbi:hypothetical protein K0M31_014514, partial [Melipona bicolor]